MGQSYVQLASDGSGKKMDTQVTTTAAQHRQVMVIGAKDTDANVAPVDATKGLAVDLTATGSNTNKILTTPDLPSGASTAAKQPALGTAGTASADVITVQGIASMTKLLVTPDSVALPANQSVNVAQINGVTPLMGAGNTGTGSARVTIASDQAVIPVSDNSGSLTVDQATGTNLHTVVDSGTITTVTTLTGTTTLTPGTAAGNLGKAEDAVHSSGDTGVFVLSVSNENLTAFAASSGDYIPWAVNRYGQHYVTAPPPSHASSNGTPITTTTTSVIAAPSAGNHLRILRIHMSNGGATPTWLAARDGAAGTQHYRTYLPQGGVMSLNLNMSGPLDLTTATRLDIVSSAAGSVEYEIDYLTVAD